MALTPLDELERALGHHFNNPVLAERALTHRSSTAGRRHACDNEQYEYLGDALLGFLAAEYLVIAYPDWSEGQLSKARARLVSAPALAKAARQLGLGAHLRLGKGEEKTGGREKSALLADAFEAVIAAIYLDAGLAPVRAFVERTLFQGTITAEGGRLHLGDRKSALQEWLQARGMPPASYRVIREAGPDHRKMFWVEAHVEGDRSSTGTGSTKKEAEQAAAQQLLLLLEKEAG
jgi:ribonuclease-3